MKQGRISKSQVVCRTRIHLHPVAGPIYTGNDELPATTEPGILERAILGTGGGFGLPLLVGISAPILLGALGVDAFTIGIPGSPWSSYTLEGSASEFDMNVNFTGLVTTSVLVGSLYAIGVQFWLR